MCVGVRELAVGMVRRAGLAVAGGLHVLLPWSRGDNSTAVLLSELHLPRLLV